MKRPYWRDYLALLLEHARGDTVTLNRPQRAALVGTSERTIMRLELHLQWAGLIELYAYKPSTRERGRSGALVLTPAGLDAILSG